MKDIFTLKAGLVISQDETPLGNPKDVMRERAPSKFPYEEYTLTGPEDARTIVPTLNALKEAHDKVKTIETEAKEIRKQAEDKIREYQKQEGLTELQQKMTGFSEKLINEVEDVSETIGDSILEHHGVLMAVHDVIKKGTVKNDEAEQKLIEVMSKYVEEDVANKILKEANQAVDDLKKSREQVKKQLSVWPAPKDIRKKVKQEVPAYKTSGIWDKVKEIASKLWESFKNLISSVSDNLSSLVSTIDQSDPLVADMKGVLSEIGQPIK
jgi:hypothetical protein